MPQPSLARGPLRSAASSPTTHAQPASPVFVDPTGRRRRAVGRATVTVFLGVTALVTVAVGSIATDAGAAVEWHPSSTAHVTPLGR